MVTGYRVKLTSKNQSKVLLPAYHHPETEDTEFLEGDNATKYQKLIGILRWGCELGRIDILLET